MNDGFAFFIRFRQNPRRNLLRVTGAKCRTTIGVNDFAFARFVQQGPDFEPGAEDGTTLFLTEAADLDLVSRALPAQGFTVLSAKLGYRPKNPIDPASLSAADLEEVEAFLAAIDANDDVQNVYVGLAG